jgi:hypothetical protein
LYPIATDTESHSTWLRAGKFSMTVAARVPKFVIVVTFT